MLYFETTTTSKNKKVYAILKRQFESFSENLKTVVDNIALLLNNKHHNYLIIFDEVKLQYSINLY